jgi:tetratricopeptide (TPR) repeat protein
MWSGTLTPGFRARLALFSGAALSALALGGCAMSPAAPPWFSEAMLEELRTQQEYADFITARYAVMTGDPASAATYYRRAWTSSPGDPGLLERATISTLAAGDAAAAVKLARGAPADAADDAPSAQLALIIDDIAEGRLKSAQTRLRKPVLGALNVDLAGFLSVWLATVENAQKGVVEADQLPGRRMVAGEQAALKAMVLMQAGRDDEAAEFFRQALRMPLATRDAVATLGASLQASRGNVQGARDLIALAAGGDDEGGPGVARVLADLDAGRKIVRPKLTARSGAAMAMFVVSGTGLVRSSPELSAMRHALVLYLDPDLAAARFALADAYTRQDRPDAALAVLQSIPDSTAWAADARMEAAAILNAEEKPAEALVMGDRALSLSQRREILVRAGDLNRFNGRLDVARKLYDLVIAADTARGRADWMVLYARATVRNEAADWAGAEEDLKAAMAIEPDRPELLNYLGYGWIKQGKRIEEGLALITRAAESRPDQGYIVDSLGWAHYQLGHYDVAIEHLERAAELSPIDPEILDHLGDAYWRSGRQDDARFEWLAALRLKPEAAREITLREKLEKGLPAMPGARLASRP